MVQNTQLHFVDDAVPGVRRKRKRRQPDGQDPGNMSPPTPIFRMPPRRSERRVTLAKIPAFAKWLCPFMSARRQQSKRADRASATSRLTFELGQNLP